MVGKIYEVFDVVDKDTSTTTSLLVAEKFGKRHADILRMIEKQITPNLSEEFTKRNISFCSKNNTLQNGKPQKFYKLTRDGFSMIAMSLTGKEAYKWKEAFLGEFNKIEQENNILKNIVWEVINGQALIGQEQALNCANIKHPRLFMQYLKESPKFYASVFEREIIRDMQCSKHKDVHFIKFTKSGFQWLLDGRDKLNDWVEVQKQIRKQKKIIPA